MNADFTFEVSAVGFDGFMRTAKTDRDLPDGEAVCHQKVEDLGFGLGKGSHNPTLDTQCIMYFVPKT